MYQSAATAETTWERGPAPALPSSPSERRASARRIPSRPRESSPKLSYPAAQQKGSFREPGKRREPGGLSSHTPPLTPTREAGARFTPVGKTSTRPRPPHAPSAQVLAAGRRAALPRPAPPPSPPATRRGRAGGGRGALAGGRCHSSSPPPPPIHPAALGRGLGARLAAGAACGRAGARLCF